MSAIPSPKHYEILLPVKRPTTTRAFRMANGEEDWFADEQASHGGRTPRSRFLMMFVLGAAATLVWQSSYGHAAREIVAEWSPQLRWLAPQTEADDAAPNRIEQITRSVDRIASDMAAGQQQIARSIDHLAAGQEQMTTEIIRLQAISQFGSSKGQEPLPHPASGPMRKAGQHAPQAR
jgi:hypothetical protein